MSEILELKNINQHFLQGTNKINVIDNLNLKIFRNSRIAIIGSSGSGKSSLLNIASLMEKPKSGDVFIIGKSSTFLNDKAKSNLRKQNIGYIHQRSSLLSEFNAFENIYITLLINNFNKKYAKEKSHELLELVNMKHRAKHKPETLSGGEQQRIAIARAICNNPEIIIADEPTGNLDENNSEIVMNELIRITEVNETALMIATHDPMIAQRMDKVFELKDKKLHLIEK